jgi:hypothetical protein
MLLDVLARRRDDRAAIITTLQRQNFFVPLDELAAARASLINALAAGDEQRFEEARKEYQVDAVRQLLDSPQGIPTRVRIFELSVPSGEQTLLGGQAVFPDLENQYNIAEPLVRLCEAGKIPRPYFDFAGLHRLDTEVFVLAGRWDHTTDYRSSIALAANYPRHYLFLADDNHTFERLTKSGDSNLLMRAFLGTGLASESFRDALKAAEPLRWTER